MGFITNRAKKMLADGTLDWDTDTLKAVLVTSSNDATVDNNFVGDITTLGELSGTGYVAGFGNSGRHVLANKAVAQDDANDRAELKADNETWTAIDAGTVAAVLVIKEVTNDADSILLGKVDLAAAKTTNGGNLTIEWADHAGGNGVLFRHTS